MEKHSSQKHSTDTVFGDQEHKEDKLNTYLNMVQCRCIHINDNDNGCFFITSIVNCVKVIEDFYIYPYLWVVLLYCRIDLGIISLLMLHDGEE